MMRKLILISLLLLSILNVHHAHGIRLIERFLSAKQDYSSVHEEKSALMRISNARIREETPVTETEKEHGSESGSNRKLMTKISSTSSSTTTTTTTTTSKNDKIDHEENNKAESTTVQKGQSSSERFLGGKEEEEENFSVNSSTVAQHPPESSAPDHYPDVLDIAEMDYSPAKRKPPIHN